MRCIFRQWEYPWAVGWALSPQRWPSTHFGRKYVISNAYIQVRHPENQCVVPVYDDYRVLFDKCDKFNRSLHHCIGLTSRVVGTFLVIVVANITLSCHVCFRMCSMHGFRQKMLTIVQ